MDTRWKGVIVAAFAGLAGAIGIWVTTASSTPTAEPPPATEVVKTAKALPVDPELARIRPQDITGRSLLAANPAAERGRGRLDPRTRGTVRPPVALGDARLANGIYQLQQGGVPAAIDAHRAEIETCHRKSPGLERSLTLVLELEPGQQGARVSSVSADSRADDTTFEQCVGQALGGASFDAKGPTTVRYPMTFGGQ